MSPGDVRAALTRYAAMDPADWRTGLSPEGARRALSEACTPLLHTPWPVPLPGRVAPKRLLIWCAANVFTAPLEWTCAFAAMGSEVVLKAPSRNPEPLIALAEAFGEGVRVDLRPHEAAWPLVAEADAVMGFGSDTAMAELASHIPPGVPHSLHGHRVSFAVVEGHSPELARALALDAALHDGRGCMSPAAVLCTGDARALAEALNQALIDIEASLPRGPLPAALGSEWRTRTGLHRVLGEAWEGPAHAVSLSPLSAMRPAPLPRFLPVHPLRPDQLHGALGALPLSTIATDLGDQSPVYTLGAPRVCAPGEMQRPPFPREHDGVDVLSTLTREAACP